MSEGPEAPLDHTPFHSPEGGGSGWLQAESFAPKYLVCLRQVGPGTQVP